MTPEEESTTEWLEKRKAIRKLAEQFAVWEHEWEQSKDLNGIHYYFARKIIEGRHESGKAQPK